MKYILIFLFLPLSILCQPKNFNDIPNKYSLEKYTPTPIFQGQTPLCAAYALANMRSIVYNINKNIISKTVKHTGVICHKSRIQYYDDHYSHFLELSFFQYIYPTNLSFFFGKKI